MKKKIKLEQCKIIGLSKKHVYIFDDYYSSKINGIGTYIRELTHCLRNLKIDVNLIVCNAQIDEFCVTVECGVKKILIPQTPNVFQNSGKIVVSLLKMYINDSKDNVFFINYSPCEILLKSLKEVYTKSKLIFVIHDMGWTMPLLGNTKMLNEIITYKYVDNNIKYKKLNDYIQEECRIYEIVNKVVVLSNDTKKTLQNIYKVKKSKIFFACNGLADQYCSLNQKQIEDIKASLFINSKEKIILYTGRICQIKGIYSLINGFKLVLKKYPCSRLVIVGTILENNKPITFAKSIASKVTFTGQISQEEISKWYKIADIGVLPSYYEQCSYTGIEMMMYGLPIVASDGFCVKNMFQHKKNALIAKIGDRSNAQKYEKNLAKQIMVLLINSAMRINIGRQARETYLIKYTSLSMQQQYEKLLVSL